MQPEIENLLFDEDTDPKDIPDSFTITREDFERVLGLKVPDGLWQYGVAQVKDFLIELAYEFEDEIDTFEDGDPNEEIDEEIDYDAV
jgi:hypothetical protein